MHDRKTPTPSDAQKRFVLEAMPEMLACALRQDIRMAAPSVRGAGPRLTGVQRGPLGIVTVLHERIHQIQRFREDFGLEPPSTAT